jgi:hypothetical protein
VLVQDFVASYSVCQYLFAEGVIRIGQPLRIPLKFEEAVSDLLKVRPPQKPQLSEPTPMTESKPKLRKK